MLDEEQEYSQKFQQIQRPRSSLIRAQRISRLNYEYYSTGLVVLQKLKSQNPMCLDYFSSWEWDSRDVFQVIGEGVISKIVKARVKFIKFQNLSNKLDIPINIIRELSHVLMENLLILNLSNNFITTVENLPNLRCTLLQQLDLSKNLITNIQPLRKCNFPYLSTLNLTKNIIISYHKLSQMQQQKFQIINIVKKIQQSSIWWANQPNLVFEPIPNLLIQPSIDIHCFFKLGCSVAYYHPNSYINFKVNYRFNALQLRNWRR